MAIPQKRESHTKIHKIIQLCPISVCFISSSSLFLSVCLTLLDKLAPLNEAKIGSKYYYFKNVKLMLKK